LQTFGSPAAPWGACGRAGVVWPRRQYAGLSSQKFAGAKSRSVPGEVDITIMQWLHDKTTPCQLRAARRVLQCDLCFLFL
jgi:hypothetical protein